MRDTDLLIVGRHGPGGIGQYISEQRRHLAGKLRVGAHKIGAFSTEGVVAFVHSVLVICWNALTYTVRSPPDIVHVHSSHRFSFYRAGYYVLFSKYVWDRPVVLHIHGSSFDVFVSTDSALVRWYQSLVFDAADEIVVLSQYWKDTLGEHTDREKLTVIPNAVDAGDYTPAFDGDVPHVVAVSNQIPRKGVVELATAIEALADRGLDFRVTIAGKGPLSNHAEELAATYDNVEYLGYVSEEDKQRLLGSGSIFVLPAYAEGLPIAMLEAMAAGNAIVSTTVGAIPEVINEDNGLLVAPRDADELTDALAELIADPERVAAMGEANREAALERFAWSTIAEELLATYEGHLDVAERPHP
ncbi:glycosyltransferase family 4 protein [Halococcus saccharolyticus]|uniref:Glycosyltransferase n=1 Tax=Halococcus saccharolyticus DSM 5350 TaxID=1227455 RepID=M0MKR1_9EURY|nr:glycosyltransferase family 4 protein [Halococcus saccharolyticus]EMA45329.1 glycosyltransferase [Halococcus saccharolyticus DSM 5350]